ncbi:hypothetical protein WJX74_010475 [Apatococcus lobatus]|uniref:t-SNARE coiled-coil homology domain-containing protein n=1 Tax=Apatococcus lobatus TaxID=904363 RepID=A0AAW1RMQ0_9CHLO
MSGVQKYDQEKQLESIFEEIKAGFKKYDGLGNGDKQTALLKELTNKMQECKNLIKEYEREARTDGLAPQVLADRKKQMVQELNTYIGLKKHRQDEIAAKAELIGTSGRKGALPEKSREDTGTVELMAQGKATIKDTDDALIRAQKIVEDTIQIGTQTAETLHGQTKQMERVLNDLDEIHFTMKKASKVIRDLTRGIATDKFIMFLFMMMVVGVIVAIVLKIAKVGAKKKTTTTSPSPSPSPTSGRRLLGYSPDVWYHVAELIDLAS